MRKIKFRAWDKEEREFINIKSFGFFENGEVWYVQAIDESERDIDPPYFTDEDELVIMQYTGLKDKNGKEIYEGDIITWLDKPIFSDSDKIEKLKDTIVFEDGCFRTKRYNELLSNLARTEKTGFKFNYLDHHETEVIGNTYEHSHLLEGESNV